MARTWRIGFCGVLLMFAACATNELGPLPPDAPFDAAIDVPVVVISDAPPPPDAPIFPDAPEPPDAPIVPDAPVFDAPFDAYMPDACVPNPLGSCATGSTTTATATRTRATSVWATPAPSAWARASATGSRSARLTG